MKSQRLIMADEIRAWKPGKIFFKSKHVKSEDRLFAKYKKPKKNKKKSKKSRIGAIKPELIAKSAMENRNQCLQCTRNFIFYNGQRIVKINLETMRIEKEYPLLHVSMCTIPNQKFFVINFTNSLVFIINKSFKILNQKRIKRRKYANIIYLDGLVYLFTNDFYNPCFILAVEAYDLDRNKWKKVLSIKSQESYCAVLAAFEGKIIVAPHLNGSVKAFDPFCNSVSKILKLEQNHGNVLLVAHDKLYCIQTGGYVFESLPRDYTQWLCIGKNNILYRVSGAPLYSLYNDSIYFVTVAFYPALYEFNLKTRRIKFVNHPY